MPWIAAPRKNVRIMVGPRDELTRTIEIEMELSWQHPYLHLFFTALFQLLFCCSSWFWFLYGKPHHLTSRLCWSFQAAFPLCDYTTYTLTSTCTAAFVSIGHPSSECNCKGYFADKVLNPQVPAPAAAAPRTPAACKHHQPFSCPFPSLAPFPSHDLPFWSWHPLPVLAALAPSSVYKIKLPGHNPIGGLPPIQQVEMPPPTFFFFFGGPQQGRCTENKAVLQAVPVTQGVMAVVMSSAAMLALTQVWWPCWCQEHLAWGKACKRVVVLLRSPQSPSHEYPTMAWHKERGGENGVQVSPGKIHSVTAFIYPH